MFGISIILFKAFGSKIEGFLVQTWPAIISGLAVAKFPSCLSVGKDGGVVTFYHFGDELFHLQIWEDLLLVAAGPEHRTLATQMSISLTEFFYINDLIKENILRETIVLFPLNIGA